jgi:CTP:molybdopterin cytidylyltransferase MocA
MKARPGAVILAAGRSSRMGEPKALMHLGGRRVIDALLNAYRSAKLTPLVVVASGAVLEALREVEDLDLVVGDPEQPMIDSVALGIEALLSAAPSVRCAVIQPVDAPFTTPEMISALTGGDDRTARVLCHDGKPGHPILLPRGLFDAAQDRPSGGLRELIGQHDLEIVDWPDDRVLADLDTPEDLARWRRVAGDALL